MQRFSKIFLSLAMGIILTLLTTNAFAQNNGMAMFQAQQGLRSLDQQMMLMTYINILNKGEGITYRVTLKDSSVKDVVSILHTDPVSHKDYLLLVNKQFAKKDSAHRYQKIYPDQTINVIFTGDDAYEGDEITSFPQDSCWMFKVITGPITVYSSNIITAGEDIFNLSKRVDIQFRYGAIEKFNIETLKVVISKDDDAMKYVEQKRYAKAILKYNQDIARSFNKNLK